MKQSKYFWTLQRSEENYGYAHAHVSLYLIPHNDYHSGLHPIVSVQWQSDKDQTPAHWYCPHAEVRTDFGSQLTAVEQLQTAARILKLLPVKEEPSQWLDILVAAGITRRIYDPRTSQYLPPSEIPADTVRKWLVRHERQCILTVLAETPDEAKREATKAFGEHITNPGRHFTSLEAITKQFQDWLAAGQPVERDRFDHLPDMAAVPEILKALGKPAEPQAIAA